MFDVRARFSVLLHHLNAWEMLVMSSLPAIEVSIGFVTWSRIQRTK